MCLCSCKHSPSPCAVSRTTFRVTIFYSADTNIHTHSRPFFCSNSLLFMLSDLRDICVCVCMCVRVNVSSICTLGSMTKYYEAYLGSNENTY